MSSILLLWADSAPAQGQHIPPASDPITPPHSLLKYPSSNSPTSLMVISISLSTRSLRSTPNGKHAVISPILKQTKMQAFTWVHIPFHSSYHISVPRQKSCLLGLNSLLYWNCSCQDTNGLHFVKWKNPLPFLIFLGLSAFNTVDVAYLTLKLYLASRTPYSQDFIPFSPTVPSLSYLLICSHHSKQKPFIFNGLNFKRNFVVHLQQICFSHYSFLSIISFHSQAYTNWLTEEC